MGRIFYIWYAIFLIAVWSLFTIARVNPDGFLVMSFQGDALHMAQAVLRMAKGEVPHRDFLTPLGILAFMPISTLVKTGFGLGKAFAYAPSFLTLLSLPAIYWVGLSRFKPAAALVFASVYLAMFFAYIHGGLLPSVSASMYYNNWGWAVAMPVVAIAVLPGRASQTALIFDALVLGIGVGFLTLTKATYAVYLLPAIILSLALNKEWTKLALSVIICIAFMAAFTFPLGGLSYWAAYVNDLRSVASNSLRPYPGLSLSKMLLSARHLPGLIALLAAVVFLRQARQKKQGLVVLVLGAGWWFVTYQNWENDPQWMVMAGLILFVLSEPVVLYNSFGWPLKKAVQVMGIVLMAMGLPLSLTQLQSLLVHKGLNGEAFPVSLPINIQADLRFRAPKQGIVRINTPYDALGQPASATMLGDEELPLCHKANGLIADLKETGKRLDNIAGSSGKSAIYTDWVSGLWMFSHLAPLPGGAPWYYGGTPGFANADYLVVPLCPMDEHVRAEMLKQIALDPALDFTEVARNDLFILLEKAPSGGSVFKKP